MALIEIDALPMNIIELDDGKILTGKPDQIWYPIKFHGKDHGFRLKIFPRKPIHWE